IFHITHALAKLLADDVVHAHAPAANLAAAALRVAGLGDLQHAGETDQHVIELARAGLHQRAPAAHVGAGATDEGDGGDAAGESGLELVIVWADDVKDAQLGVGLVDHLVDVLRPADVAVGVDEAGHRPHLRVVDDLVPLRRRDLRPRAYGLDLAIGDEDGRVVDGLAGAGNDLADMYRELWPLLLRGRDGVSEEEQRSERQTSHDDSQFRRDRQVFDRRLPRTTARTSMFVGVSR